MAITAHQGVMGSAGALKENPVALDAVSEHSKVTTSRNFSGTKKGGMSALFIFPCISLHCVNYSVTFTVI